MQYNYPETKELCLKFLTLVISVLVFSITFSEKIIDIQNSSRVDKLVLVISWISLILAIVLCGIGLTIHTRAGGQAVYGENDLELNRLSQLAYRFIILGGSAFVLGLGILTLAGIRLLFR